jgi:hypothetical protein
VVPANLFGPKSRFNRPSGVASLRLKLCQMHQSLRNLGMLGAKSFLGNRHRTLIEWLGGGVIACLPEQICQVD